MNNLLINCHLFIINISNGNARLILKKGNNKLSIPKIVYEGKDSIDFNIKKFLKSDINISCFNINSCHVYSKNNIIDIIFVAFTKDDKLNDGYNYYILNELDQKLISKDVINYLKDNMRKMVFIKQLYNEYFSLRELKDLYENIYHIELDRRNFRKRLLNFKIITETEDVRKKDRNGRPNKLYKFNEPFDINLI